MQSETHFHSEAKSPNGETTITINKEQIAREERSLWDDSNRKRSTHQQEILSTTPLEPYTHAADAAVQQDPRQQVSPDDSSCQGVIFAATEIRTDMHCMR
jgi:hypothetical protein